MTFSMAASLAVVFIEILAALAIAVQAVIRFTKMSHCTRGPILFAWMLLGCASVAALVDVLSGKAHPTIYSAMLMCAVAALVWLDRRHTR